MLDVTRRNGHSHWENHVLAAIETNRLQACVVNVGTQTSPTADIEVTCADRNCAEGLAAVLAGTSATAYGCHDSGTHRRYVILVVGAPVVVSWTECFAPTTPDPGAQRAWTVEPALGTGPNPTVFGVAS